MAPVFLLLSFALLAVTILVAIAIASVLADDEVAYDRQLGQWQPPLAQGTALRQWVSGVTRMIVADELKSPPSARLPVRLIRKLYQGFARTLKHVGTFGAGERPAPCPSEPAATFGVTALEALAIADHVRRNCDKHAREEIEQRLVVNHHQLATAIAGCNDKLRCPLLAADGICAAFELRPLHCRTCSSCSMQAGVFHASHRNDLLTLDLEEGLSTALSSEGLDGRVYELNSALEVALRTPNAAESWAKGEPVFAQCRPHQHPVGTTA